MPGHAWESANLAKLARLTQWPCWRIRRLRGFPELVEAPGSQGAAIADDADAHHLFELFERDGAENEIVLLVIRILAGRGKAGGEEHMLLLAGVAISDPEPAEVDHFGCFQAQLFLELPAGQVFGVIDFGFPSALGKLDGPLLDGVTELLNQPDMAVVDGQDNGARVLFDYAVDALLAVGAENLIFAQPHPAIAV